MTATGTATTTATSLVLIFFAPGQRGTVPVTAVGPNLRMQRTEVTTPKIAAA